MFAVIDPDLFNILLGVWAPFTFPAFNFSSLSATNKPILFVAFSPIVIVPLSGLVLVRAPVSPKGPNSTVFVPTLPEAVLPIVSVSPCNTGIVGTAAYIPTAFSTRPLVCVVPPRSWFSPWVIAVVPILIVPPTLTSCISWSIPTPTLLSPVIFIVPELYTPLVHLELAVPDKPERPISPPGRIVVPAKFLWALKLAAVLSSVFSTKTVSNVLIPGLNTVIIPKLPLESIFISFWLSAFISTLPFPEVPEGAVVSFILT